MEKKKKKTFPFLNREGLTNKNSKWDKNIKEKETISNKKIEIQNVLWFQTEKLNREKQ